MAAAIAAVNVQLQTAAIMRSSLRLTLLAPTSIFTFDAVDVDGHALDGRDAISRTDDGIGVYGRSFASALLSLRRAVLPSDPTTISAATTAASPSSSSASSSSAASPSNEPIVPSWFVSELHSLLHMRNSCLLTMVVDDLAMDMLRQQERERREKDNFKYLFTETNTASASSSSSSSSAASNTAVGNSDIMVSDAIPLRPRVLPSSHVLLLWQLLSPLQLGAALPLIVQLVDVIIRSGRRRMVRVGSGGGGSGSSVSAPSRATRQRSIPMISIADFAAATAAAAAASASGEYLGPITPCDDVVMLIKAVKNLWWHLMLPEQIDDDDGGQRRLPLTSPLPSLPSPSSLRAMMTVFAYITSPLCSLLRVDMRSLDVSSRSRGGGGSTHTLHPPPEPSPSSSIRRKSSFAAVAAQSQAQRRASVSCVPPL